MVARTAAVMDLACTTDGAYAPHTGTMLQSVFVNNRHTSFRVHVLSHDLGDGDRARLRAVGERFGATLDFLAVGAGQVAPFPGHRFHRSCWYRVLLPELLPQLQRVLYLDSDLVVNDALDDLWETDVSRHPFAAVINPFYPFFPDYHVSHLGLPAGSPYYNSGVLLMNLESLRRDGFGDRIRAYAARHPENLYPEQDAMNALYQYQCLPLHPRWNAQSTLFELKPRQLPFTAEQITEATTHPAIVHFIGPYKPWTYLCTHPLRNLYAGHRRQVPWPVEPLLGRSVRAWALRLLPTDWRYRWIRAENVLRSRMRNARDMLTGER